MKKVVIILCCLIFTGCTTENYGGKLDISSNSEEKQDISSNSEEKQDTSSKKKKKLDISSDEYFKKLDSIFTKVTKDNEFLYYSGFTKHYPYIEVAIKPRKRISESEMEEQSKIIETDILSQLKKYEYESGSIFRYNFEYININFYDYTDSGQLSRNGGPFLQIEILEI